MLFIMYDTLYIYFAIGSPSFSKEKLFFSLSQPQILCIVHFGFTATYCIDSIVILWQHLGFVRLVMMTDHKMRLLINGSAIIVCSTFTLHTLIVSFQIQPLLCWIKQRHCLETFQLNVQYIKVCLSTSTRMKNNISKHLL